jgi:hypothetical protein
VTTAGRSIAKFRKQEEQAGKRNFAGKRKRQYVYKAIE